MPGLRKRLHDIDVQIGQRLRELRVRRDLSQDNLAEMLGITFQQIQKYEKGGSRIAASTLWDVSQKLDAPVAWFFEGLEKKDGLKKPPEMRLGDIRLFEELSELPGDVRHSLGALIRTIKKKS